MAVDGSATEKNLLSLQSAVYSVKRVDFHHCLAWPNSSRRRGGASLEKQTEDDRKLTPSRLVFVLEGLGVGGD